MPLLVPAPDQIAQIRKQVNETGSAIVARDKLHAFCPDELSVPEQFVRIAEIASEEEWEFEFIGDSIVRFTSMVASRRLALI